MQESEESTRGRSNRHEPLGAMPLSALVVASLASLILLAAALVRLARGPEAQVKLPKNKDLDDLAASWSAETAQEFGAVTADFEHIDVELWKE